MSFEQPERGCPSVHTGHDLQWLIADRSHRHQLKTFTCTEPPGLLYDVHRGRHHPALWELQVQSHIRDIRPPRPPDEALLLGLASGSIAAVSHFGFDRSGEQFIVWAVATDVAHRRRGHASAILQRTLAVLAVNKSDQGLDCGVFTRIHRSNEASQALFAEVGFACLDDPADGELQHWIAAL